MADTKISNLTNYPTPLDADVLPVVDTANATTKKVTWANIKATLKTYFDTIYTTTSAVATQITTAVSGTYAPLASPALTGSPTAPTPATSDNDTSIATTAHVQANKIGYAIQGATALSSPNDATLYYFGQYHGNGLQNLANKCRLYIPKAGTIKAAYIFIYDEGVLGSTETSTISIRLNDSSDTTISAAVTVSATQQVFSNTALSIAVAAGDFIEFKWLTPTWATNPTNIRPGGIIYIE